MGRGLPRRSVALVAGSAATLLLAGCSGEPGAAPTATASPSTSSAAPTSSASPSATSSTPPAGQDDPRLATYYSQQLAWAGCGGRFQCATLTVPVDYDQPAGATMHLSVVRLPTTEPGRLGSIVLNPGGPGGSGVEYARSAAFPGAVLTAKVIRRYDVVGFDPRGVGKSDPVDCLTDAQTDEFMASDPTPDDAAEVSDWQRIAAGVGRGCASRAAGSYSHLDTVSAARDLDILRRALGDERLTYLGKSYGTYLGTTYAELFPGRVGRMVLDGVLPADLSLQQLSHDQAVGFEDALRRFVADCDGRRGCPLPDGVDAGVARIQQFVTGLDAAPLPAQQGRPLTEALGLSAILSYLYAPPSDWAQLRSGLATAFAGDGGELLDMLDSRIQRRADGTYVDNANEVFYPVTCLDRPFATTPEQLQALATQWSADAPTFGRALAWGMLACSGWPASTGRTPVPLSGAAVPPLLLVTTRHDPATPYAWGERMAAQLPGSTLVQWTTGDGHTAYLSEDRNRCVDDAVDTYLLTGTTTGPVVQCT